MRKFLLQNRKESICYKFLAGYTFVELIVAISIMAIVVWVVVASLDPFSNRQRLSSDMSKLLEDLMKTQQFATTQKNEYKYYGLRFYGGLGEKGDRDGYKIVRFEPQNGVSSLYMDPRAVPSDLDINDFTIVQSSVSSDTPEFLEDTFFSDRVSIDASSDFQIGDTVVFVPMGSATFDGANLLDSTQDEIVLSSDTGEIETIVIIPLTGHANLQ